MTDEKSSEIILTNAGHGKDSFRKPNAALVMVPRLGRLTVIARKLFNVVLHHTQHEIVSIEGSGGVVTARHRFSTPLAVLCKGVTNKDSNLVTEVRSALKEMRRIELDWDTPDAGSEVIWSSMSLLSEARVVKVGSQLHAQWAFPPTLFETIADPERYTPLSTAQMADLKSYTAVALFEIVSRYRNNPTKLTAIKPVEWWMDALIASPALLDPVTKEKRGRNWAHFKDRRLKDAIEEINTKTDLTVELIDHKKGVKIVDAQFKVTKKEGLTLGGESQGEESSQIKLRADVALSAQAIGLRIADVLHLKEQGASDDVLEIALQKLKTRMDRQDLEKVDTPLPFLRKILAELKEQIGPSSAKPNKSGQIRMYPDQSQSPSTQSDAPLLKPLRDERIAEARKDFAAFTTEQMRELGEKALSHMPTQMATSYKRKVQTNEYSAPLLVTKMAEVYLTERYGPNWAVEE